MIQRDPHVRMIFQYRTGRRARARQPSVAGRRHRRPRFCGRQRAFPSKLPRMLETIQVETNPEPNAAVIWLHGLGADGHDFEPIVPEIVRPGERAWRFVFPNAPVRPVTINGGMPMRAWYDLKGLDRKAAEDLAGFRDTDVQIRQLIAREGKRGIPANRIVLAGFSQGGAVSLYTVPRFPEKLAGVMALSCYLPGEGSFQDE